MRAKKGVALAGFVMLASIGTHDEATGAQCPTECRREAAEVMCRTDQVDWSDGTTTVVRYYWSNGGD